jgi:hypothetical protein
MAGDRPRKRPVLAGVAGGVGPDAGGIVGGGGWRSGLLADG